MLQKRLLWLSIIFILAVTLVPLPGKGPQPEPMSFQIVGRRGLADVAVNLLLFMPPGFLLMRLVRRLWPVVICVLALSLSIEVTQMIVPGRYANVNDVVFNLAGGLLGATAAWLCGLRRGPIP